MKENDYTSQFDFSNKPPRRKTFIQSLTDTLTGTLGFFGFVLLYFLYFTFIMAPLYIIGAPYWVTIIACILLCFFSDLIILVNTALYPWAFIIAVRGPQNIISILFYICFAVWFLMAFLPFILSFFSKR